jgi:phenylalanyl-tRNA synthetase beta chain
MKVTLNWLKQYVEFNWSPEELRERLTMLGLEVEGMKKLGGEFEGVVVAQVITRDKHPNADKLSLCRVNDGAGERQIVCGAQNFKPGDKVPLILPGYSLPAKPGEQPMTIKVGKIRGVESQGMLCSPKELGLAEDAQGLLVLPEDAKVGQPFAEHLGRAAGDVVYDLEITPNRPDLNSVIGIAREISAATENPHKIPVIEIGTTTLRRDGASMTGVQDSAARPEPELPVDQWVAVRIDDPELCPRYTARVVRGVKIGPSPDWLRQTLEKVGVRSINNVVDVTNYVMLEIGQPLHAFDFHLLSTKPAEPNAPRQLIIRRAQDGELFTTIDGQKRTLTNSMLVIADTARAIALAGVMGGQNTEINEQTADVLIESAYFKPQNIRATSKKLDLRTESSYRFERGADVAICDWASRRSAQLILETAGGQLADGVVDVYPKPVEPHRITLRHQKAGQLLGVEIPDELQQAFLRRLGLELVGVAAEDRPRTSLFQVPSFRVDLKREVDLIEEVTRIYGIEKIPATAPRGAIGSHPYDAVHDQLADARRILTALGLGEAQGQTLISDTVAKWIGGTPVLLENPLSSDMNVLRPSLLPGLLEALRHNVSRKNGDIALFELGRVFSDGSTREERRVAVALTGQRYPTFWSGDERDAKFDSYDLKGLLEEFFERFGVRGLSYIRRPDPTVLFVESAAIQLGKQAVGELGQLLPVLAKRYDLREAVWLAELNLDLLLARRSVEKSFKPLPAFPAIRRDVAMIVTQMVTHESVLNVVKQSRPQHLESVELFDVFHGKNVPAGHKSMAYAFTYRSPERTLTDAEVNAVHESLVQQFRQALQATVRE